MRRASAEVTHHDAVAGTSESWVVRMYADDLQSGISAANSVILPSIQTLASNNGQNSPPLTLDQWILQDITPNVSVAGTEIFLWNSTLFQVRMISCLSVDIQNLYNSFQESHH